VAEPGLLQRSCSKGVPSGKTVVPKGTGSKNSCREVRIKLKKMHFAYILKSEKTGRYYYGSTSDLEQRLKNHNSGKVKSTKSGRPWVIHYYETFESKEEALKRELFLNQLKVIAI
jgi:putative endonuclease